MDYKMTADYDKDTADVRVLRSQARAYPSIPDQLDTIFWRGIDAWKETIQAVKDAHPK